MVCGWSVWMVCGWSVCGVLETIRISAAGYPSRSVPRSLGGLSLGGVYVGGLREWCVGGLCGWCVGGPSVGGWSV